MDHILIKDTVSALLHAVGLSFDDIVVAEDNDIIRVDIQTIEASRLIGWHGETLNSLQHLVKSIVREREHLDRYPFIVLDVDGYRKIQEEKVCAAADKKADFVRRTGNRIALPPMSPYFRRIVHLHVAGNQSLQDLATESIGEGDYRQVVLRLKNEKMAGAADDGELAPVISEDDGGLENLDI